MANRWRTSTVAALLAVSSFASRAEDIATVKNVHVSVLHDFHHEWNGLEGAEPGMVAIGHDGALYGTTASGGTYGAGTVFRIKPDGTFETLYVFKGPDGFRPDPCLLPAADGALYGTIGAEFPSDRPRVFRITADGLPETVAVMYSPRTAEQRFTVFIRGSDDHLYGLDNFQDLSLVLRRHKNVAESGPVLRIEPKRDRQASGSTGAPTADGDSTPAPASTEPLVPTDSNALCGNSMLAADGHIWGPRFPGNDALGRSVSTDVIDGMDVAFRMDREAPATTRTRSENPDYRIAASGFDRPVQAQDGTVFATSRYQEDGPVKFAIIGITAQLTAVTRTTLDVLSPDARPVFGLVASRDGYFYGLAQGTPSLIYRFRPGGPVEQVHVFEATAPEPTFRGPIVPDPRDGSLYVTLVNGGTHHDGAIYRISVPP